MAHLRRARRYWRKRMVVPGSNLPFLRRYRHEVIISDGNTSKTVFSSASFRMSDVFCLDTNFDKTLEFLSFLRSGLLREATREERRRGLTGISPIDYDVTGIRSYIDFSTMSHITTSAALILAAYYDRRKFISGRNLNTVDEHKWTPGVKDILLQVGFKEVLNMKEPEGDVIQYGSVRILKFMSAEQADGSFPGRLLESLVALLPNNKRDDFEDIQVYGGIFEAILNSKSWAYPDDHLWDYTPLKRWWITGSVNLEDSSVTIVAYDQGVSIPASLPRWKHFGRFERLIRRLAARAGMTMDITSPTQDGIAIEIAMRIAKTATGLPQHGKGLHTMLEVAQRAPWGRLRVLSRNGEYVWCTGQKPTSRSHPHSIGGTLVEWRLRLR